MTRQTGEGRDFGRKPPERPPGSFSYGSRGAPVLRQFVAPVCPCHGGYGSPSTGTGDQSAGEGGAPDQGIPKDKDQYNFTDPQSRIMPGPYGMTQGYNAQAAAESRQSGVEESLP